MSNDKGDIPDVIHVFVYMDSMDFLPSKKILRVSDHEPHHIDCETSTWVRRSLVDEQAAEIERLKEVAMGLPDLIVRDIIESDCDADHDDLVSISYQHLVRLINERCGVESDG